MANLPVMVREFKIPNKEGMLGVRICENFVFNLEKGKSSTKAGLEPLIPTYNTRMFYHQAIQLIPILRYCYLFKTVNPNPKIPVKTTDSSIAA